MKPAPFARTAALSIALALTCATAALPAAAKSVAEWQTITSQAKIPLEQAITRATQAVPGKAIEAQLDDGDFRRNSHGGQFYFASRAMCLRQL